MLRKLSIQNYAIIDELEIEFSGKLNIITGETGAGKSIIMGALGLILGQRADSSVLLNHAKKSIIEGIFVPDLHKESVTVSIQRFLEENELDIAEELIVRREIGVNGKSRAFINDTPVNLATLAELSSRLVDLHQQFDTLALGKTDFQRQVLDALAGHSGLLETYLRDYQEWQALRRECELLKERQFSFEKEADYNRFQFDELEEARFRENELEEIEAELKLMGNAESIRHALGAVYHNLVESEEPLVAQLKSSQNLLSGYSSFHPGVEAILQRMQSAQIELRDIADEVDALNRQIHFDPEKLEQMNERLSLGYRLQKKHGVNSTEGLLTIRRQLEEKLQAVMDLGQQIKDKEEAAENLLAEVRKQAGALSDGRKKQVKTLEERVNKLLVQVGMPNARLKVDVQATELNAYGADAVEFLFDANRSGQFQPVRKVASGGELSRLMLCIKSLVAQSFDLPTLIFDEIDTGISGEAARQVGLIMKGMAASRQLICITHQPQIAGKADAHFFVYKEIVGNSVKTGIRMLGTEERITAIAKMLSGEKPTAAAMENAREMVGN